MRRGTPTGPARAKKRSPLPLLIIGGIIIALVFCWIFGRGCGGNKEAEENDKLREYAVNANKVISRSATAGAQFDGIRTGIADLSRDDTSTKLSQVIADCESIAKDAGKIEVPPKAEDIHPVLEMSLDLRVDGVKAFKKSILDVQDNKSTEQTPQELSDSLMDLVVSDGAMNRYREQLKKKLDAANLGFDSVADSTFIPKADDALLSQVSAYMKDIAGEQTGDELHGVAVTGIVTTPARVDSTQSGLAVLEDEGSFTVKVTVQNQGNQTEEDIPIVATLDFDPEGTQQKETQKIIRLKPNESSTLIFEDLKPQVGSDKVNILKVVAGPVDKEVKTDNNSMELKFIVRARE
ncbi:MAG: hypothetical protein JW738_06440 [Actinobacteria bacterium]|nr:hypothetical protein [Actinomycetota bacterium]